ncbi:polyprenol monophosphomannose synthase [Tropheryma whipplei]|uniref:Glycosyltransferase n=1 Tax=Tropheryma whipplei (strain Twist) TaxID=203267 RepID=Q83FH1_TROWT|nr:polyprenol monophosphomannose synthase [Tropheryma whipplei]AAO44862.1 glycosyltransferase [Tropheryma whipplei str. Twist]MCO8182720.1 polyprenol monophosphomannose synthase [Tropheryma whipplei]MCO8190483.1 polyprenol monophosphomannose synthase [Tropheryma whipplei]CAD67436.1 putative glycosyl transferase [Tropheryma whipplei TW08/27]
MHDLSRHPVIIIPTYNERESLPRIVADIRSVLPDINIVVVDDNSPDRTGVLADRLAESDDRMSVVHRSKKAGLGAAYLHAFSRVIESGARVIVQMDADGSHSPRDLKRLLSHSQDYDVVIGSRWITGGVVVNWSMRRKLLSKMGSFYSRILLRIRVRDVTSGFKVWKAEALRKMDFSSLNSRGYCFQIDLLREAIRSGASVKEVPIRFADRERGASKMTGWVILEALLRVTAWGLLDAVKCLFGWLRIDPRNDTRPACKRRPTKRAK